MKSLPLLILPLLLAACGGGSDPTPEKEDAAPAAAIEATVGKTEAQQARAENVAERMEDAEERGAKLADETLARDDAATGASNNAVIPPID